MSRRHQEAAQQRRWKRVRRRVLERDGYRCRKCGKPGVLEVHHVQPLDEGGDDSLGNLLTYCRGCHIEHHRACEIDPDRVAWQAALDAL